MSKSVSNALKLERLRSCEGVGRSWVFAVVIGLLLLLPPGANDSVLEGDGDGDGKKSHARPSRHGPMVTANPAFEEHLLARSESVKDFLTLNRTRLAGGRREQTASAASSSQAWSATESDDARANGGEQRPSTADAPSAPKPVFMYSGAAGWWSRRWWLAVPMLRLTVCVPPARNCRGGRCDMHALHACAHTATANHNRRLEGGV